jgi:hypothetical protein
MAQADGIVSNGSGAAVRADINNQLAAVFTNHSGTTEPTTTYAYQFWADTTNNLLKIRNSTNSGWVTLRQLDGEFDTLPVENGTNSAPSIYFKASGTDSGFYSPGTDQVAVSTVGVQRVNFNAATEVVFNDTGADVDFRIEGDTDANLFKVDAGADEVSISSIAYPKSDGTADQSLVTDGSGSLSFATRARLELGTVVASTSGTSIDFTGIPSWVKKITVMFNGVSTNGTSNPLVQLGSGSPTTSGYVATGAVASVAGNTAYTVGFGVLSGLAANTIDGSFVFANQASNTWIGNGVFTLAGTNTAISAGRVNISGTLDRIRITTVNGTDTFDAGSINILYEG